MGELLASEVIRLLKKGDRKILGQIYNANRKAFINFAKKMGFSQTDALDAYQESIVIFWENIVEGKVKGLKSSISTYLFAIGKNRLLRNRKQQAHLSFNVEEVLSKKNFEIDVNFLDVKLTKRQRLMQKALKRMGEKCVALLQMFYVEGLDLDEIKEVLGFKNKASLRSQKSRCVKQMKEIIKRYE